mmetsp:Transcript_51188/g.123577  ORF Transcript_51188/g.123577 Transcript_51188/m.123577 type:complete len:620 (+) Transcript_51188:203-2062(+)
MTVSEHDDRDSDEFGMMFNDVDGTSVATTTTKTKTPLTPSSQQEQKKNDQRPHQIPPCCYHECCIEESNQRQELVSMNYSISDARMPLSRTKKIKTKAKMTSVMTTNTVLLLVMIASVFMVETDRQVRELDEGFNENPQDTLKMNDGGLLHLRLTDDQEALNDPRDENSTNFLNETLHVHLPLFEVVDSIKAIGPTEFPKPTYMYHSKGVATSSEGLTTHTIGPEDDIVTYITPVSGTHRPEQDAVFIFAAEYPLANYILFLSTLRLEAKFDGDIVMAISPIDWEDKKIREYLESGHPNVIVYVVKYTCFNAEGVDVASSKGGIRVCLCHNLYGKRPKNSSKLSSSSTIIPLPDVRHPRTVQNSRYELYWIWATMYNPTSWIMLIDARDTIFASNPFDHVPRRQPDNDEDDKRRTIEHQHQKERDEGGLLLFFGENVEATRLGQSRHNRKWLTNAYGNEVAEALREKPTICSGSTMGEQQAVDTYLRAMVGESDETQTVLAGSDQGFHNYLYYSCKLLNALSIREIIVQDQGFGIINNMGALRTKDLNEWGNGKILEIVTEPGDDKKVVARNVRNWDGTLSPVVHQFDRHKILTGWWYKTKSSEYRDLWMKRQSQSKPK